MFLEDLAPPWLLVLDELLSGVFVGVGFLFDHYKFQREAFFLKLGNNSTVKTALIIRVC